jgi:hypothetical protein
MQKQRSGHGTRLIVAWCEGNPTVAQKLADSPGMKFADESFVAAGCPSGSSEFVQSHANSSAHKMVSLIPGVLEMPLSAQDKMLLLRRSFQLKILHLSRVAHKSDALDATSTIEKEIVAGVLGVMKCSDAYVDTAGITLPVRLGGLGIHLMSDRRCCLRRCVSVFCFVHSPSCE